MNLLVTGGCGFIGSNFINYYFNKNKNVKIVNIDAMYYCASVNNVEKDIRESKRYKFIEGNINDINLIKYILKEEKITHIIHFAAQSHVDNSFDDSLLYTEDNIRGTHVLLESVRKVNLDIIFLHILQVVIP